MHSEENSTIRIPFTSGQKIWLGIFMFLAAGLVAATCINQDPLFLFGFLALYIFGFPIGRWIAHSPGEIEFSSHEAYCLKSRRAKLPWANDGDNWRTNILPNSLHLRSGNTGFRWSNERLEIITSTRVIYLGSGEKMLPVRDWLVRHGLQPK